MASPQKQRHRERGLEAVVASTFADFDHARNKPGETCRLAVVCVPGAWLRCSNCVRMDAQ